MCSTVKNCGNYTTKVSEYNDDDSTSQGRGNGQSSIQRNCIEENIQHKHNVHKRLSSQFQEDDEDISMQDADSDLQVRHTSPTTSGKKRGVKRHNGDHIHTTFWRDRRSSEGEMENSGLVKRDRTSPRRKIITNRPVWRDRTPSKIKTEESELVWRDQISPDEEMELNCQDESSKSWFKIIIPYGRKYDKTWLLNTIQSHCSVPFTPVDFHYVKMRAQFFVQDVNTASALKDVSYKIHDEENQKIPIFVNHSIVPHSVQNKFSPKQMKTLKLSMDKRYDVAQKALDLQSFRFDPDLVDNDIDMILNRRNCMTATLEIIGENFPELFSLNLRSNKLHQLDGLSDILQKAPKIKSLDLSRNKLKSTWELDKIKALKLEKLWLQGNPLCDNHSSHSSYVSAIRNCFPKLLFLDGHKLVPQVNVETEAPDIMKSSEESCKGSEALKNLILQFLQQYYWVYDFGDRHDLLNAYHNEACFSLTIPFNPEDPAPSNLIKYSKSSRNMKKRKDPVLLVQLLRHTKHDIVDSLSVLPKTQHDISSFVMDMCMQTEKMICFTVNGLFKEVEEVSHTPVRAFTRIFIAIPAENSSICIVNDQLFMREVSPKETTPVPTPSSTLVANISKERQEMVQMFSIQSGMKPEWSLKCLDDNAWDYVRAGQIFTILKAERKIPEEAFKQNL